MEGNLSLNSNGSGQMNAGNGPMRMTMKNLQHIPLTTAWILFAVKVTFFLLILIGNSLVIAVFCRSRKIRAVPYNVYILALAITDLATAVFTLPMDIYKNIIPNFFDPDDPIPAHYMDKSLCMAGMFSISQPLTWSSTTLMVIAADRLIATMWPLKYHNIVTHGRAIMVLLVWWFLTSIPMYVATAHTDLISYNPKMPCLIPYQYEPTLKITVVVLWGTAQLAVCYVIYAIVAMAICSGRTQVSKQKRITIMMAIVLVIFTICSVPLFVMNLVGQTGLAQADRMILAFVTFALMHANSFANPIIYNVANKTFRKEFKAMCGCRQSSSEESDEKTGGVKSLSFVTETNHM